MRLEKITAIGRVKYNDWATPIGPVPKPDGTVYKSVWRFQGNSESYITC